MNKTEQIIRKVAASFLLRNLIIFFMLLSTNTGVPLALGELTPKLLLIEAILMTNSYGAFLLHNLVLYPIFLKRRKYFLYAITTLILLVLSSQLYSYLKEFFYQEPSHYSWQKWIAMYWVELIYYWASLCIYLAYEYYRDRERLFQVEQEKKELELRQLNEQLNPHFLFNALNNTYSHLLQKSSDGTELILKLSELMRYVLDSSKKPRVLLEEEVSFIEHFIAFEKERLGERCQVNYTSHIQTEEAYIIPLILFHFVENAFKHGTTSIRATTIDIKMEANKQQVQLFIQNKIHQSSKISTHTGLINTLRRLELLYPKMYELDISEANNLFTVNLKLFDIACLSNAS